MERLQIPEVLFKLAAVLETEQNAGASPAQLWKIIPPYRLSAEGAPLWRLLASELASHPRRGRLALELRAGEAHGRVHAGLWVPGGVSARGIARAVIRAWPGCGLAPGSPPSPPEGRIAASESVPVEGPWGPLVDYQQRAERGVVEFEDKPLRVVLVVPKILNSHDLETIVTVDTLRCR